MLSAPFFRKTKQSLWQFPFPVASLPGGVCMRRKVPDEPGTISAVGVVPPLQGLFRRKPYELRCNARNLLNRQLFSGHFTGLQSL
jgi:hypothetical protein